MIHARTDNHRARAFTLIEVMIAIVIMGLGVLSLTAIFAGAATQQQRSTRESQAVSLSRNAEAILSRTLGTLEGPGLANAAASAGQWFPVVSAQNDPALTIDPINNPPLIYSVIDAEPLPGWYSVPDPDFTVGSTIEQGAGLGTHEEIRDQLRFDLRQQTSAFGGQMPFSLPHDRVIPRSLRVRVTIKSFQPPMGPIDPDPRVIEFGVVDPFVQLDPSAPDRSGNPFFRQATLQEIVPSPADPLTDYLDAIPTGRTPVSRSYDVNFSDLEQIQMQPQPFALPAYPSEFGDFILLDTAEQATSFRQRAFLEFSIDVGPNEFISRIDILQYRFKNARLVSLSDRFLFEADERFPNGRRPVMGYALFLRTLPGSGELQYIIFSYSLQPLSTPDFDDDQVFSFIPPETPSEIQAGRGLVRKIDAITLGFDEDVQRFYIAFDDERVTDGGRTIDTKTLFEPGQILIVASTGGGSGDGADAPVRILSQGPERDEDTGALTGRLRAFLDDSPRINGRSVLDDFDSERQIDVWTFNPIVESLTEDEAEWRIKPIEARVFQTASPF